MEQRIRALREQMEQRLGQVDSKEKLAAFWQEYLGKKGSIAELMKGLGAVSKEDRPAMGKVINEFKAQAEARYKALNEKMEEIEVEGTELLARALCHELDHLEGIMYVTKVEGELYDTVSEEETEEETEEPGEETAAEETSAEEPAAGETPAEETGKEEQTDENRE